MKKHTPKLRENRKLRASQQKRLTRIGHTERMWGARRGSMKRNIRERTQIRIRLERAKLREVRWPENLRLEEHDALKIFRDLPNVSQKGRSVNAG